MSVYIKINYYFFLIIHCYNNLNGEAVWLQDVRWKKFLLVGIYLQGICSPTYCSAIYYHLSLLVQSSIPVEKEAVNHILDNKAEFY